jgi:hypothetical protein
MHMQLARQQVASVIGIAFRGTSAWEHDETSQLTVIGRLQHVGGKETSMPTTSAHHLAVQCCT